MAFCACGYDYGYEPEHATCPKCGASTQVFVNADGARAVAHVFPVTVTAESNHPDGSRKIVTGSHSHRSTSRVSADGVMLQEYEGRPARNEEDVLQACESLMEAMRRQGIELVAKFRQPDGPESGIDAIAATIGGDEIPVQVVGVRRQQLLAELGRTGAAAATATVEELADDVVRKVEAKRDAYPRAVREHVVLLVDAIRSPGHTMPEVVAALRADARADVLRSTGYKAVWLSGSTTALTVRLDDTDQSSADEVS
jgi:hypothetical protein